MRRTLAECSLLFAALAATGCATFSRDAFLRQHTGDHVYDEKLETLWPEVRGFFKDQGFDVIDAPGEFKLETAWREEMAGSRVAGYWHRYFVEGFEVSPGHSRLRVTRLAKRATDSASYDERVGAAGTPTTASGPNALVRETEADESYSSTELQARGEDRADSTLQRWAATRAAERDFALELLLMKRLDPEGAAELEAAAEAQAKR